ncbi:RDD family protein [Modestobacter italicus]|uniref:RDD family protein n=1 Tax=Modestobacter italicus (strain DSM 44449 / CECT 9708 / BC 501) TaxID=2732864 RepID=UPI0009FD5967|nr:RDD family protein [Modestobacter marinus]
MATAERPPGTPAAEHPWHSSAQPARPPRSPVAPAGGPRRAGLVSRTLAAGVDIVVALGLLLAGYLGTAGVLFLAQTTSFRFPVPGSALLIALGLAVLAGYLTVTWALTGRSYGDQLLGLRVTDRRGRRPRWSVAAARAVLSVLLPLGVLWVAVSRQNRSLQDLLLRTSVVYDWPAH